MGRRDNTLVFGDYITAYEKVAVPSGKYLSQKQHIVPVLILIGFASSVLENTARWKSEI
jgi:hypothetical protein